MEKSTVIFLAALIVAAAAAVEEPPREKRQSPLSRAWEENLPGVQPFWEKYKSGPFGIVIRGWQFSRCASEQVSAFLIKKFLRSLKSLLDYQINNHDTLLKDG